MPLTPEKQNDTTPPPNSHPKHPGPTDSPDSSSLAVDQAPPAALRALDPIPQSGPPRDRPFQSPSAELPKPRPLPPPPLVLQLSPSSSDSHRISDHIPSSPPPPYSMSLAAENPALMSRDLSRVVAAAPHTTLPPEPPVIMAPLPDDQAAQGRAPYDSFLCHSPPANTWIAVETSHSEYVLLVRLPGFRRDGITIATKRRRILHVVADSWEPEGGHFERRVSFGYDADLAQVRAEFDGEMLRIVVPRRISVNTIST